MLCAEHKTLLYVFLDLIYSFVGKNVLQTEEQAKSEREALL